MAAAGFAVGKNASQEDVEKALGVDLTHKLKEITSAIFKNVDEDLASLVGQHDELRAAIKQLYPKQNVLQVVFELPEK